MKCNNIFYFHFFFHFVNANIISWFSMEKQKSMERVTIFLQRDKGKRRATLSVLLRNRNDGHQMVRPVCLSLIFPLFFFSPTLIASFVHLFPNKRRWRRRVLAEWTTANKVVSSSVHCSTMHLLLVVSTPCLDDDWIENVTFPPWRARCWPKKNVIISRCWRY